MLNFLKILIIRYYEFLKSFIWHILPLNFASVSLRVKMTALFIIKQNFYASQLERALNQPRPIKITRHYTKHAEGSVLVELGRLLK